MLQGFQKGSCESDDDDDEPGLEGYPLSNKTREFQDKPSVNTKDTTGAPLSNEEWIEVERLITRILEYRVTGVMLAQELSPENLQSVDDDFKTVIKSLRAISDNLRGRKRPGNIMIDHTENARFNLGRYDSRNSPLSAGRLAAAIKKLVKVRVAFIQNKQEPEDEDSEDSEVVAAKTVNEEDSFRAMKRARNGSSSDSESDDDSGSGSDSEYDTNSGSDTGDDTSATDEDTPTKPARSAREYITETSSETHIPSATFSYSSFIFVHDLETSKDYRMKIKRTAEFREMMESFCNKRDENESVSSFRFIFKGLRLSPTDTMESRKLGDGVRILVWKVNSG